MHKFVLSRCGTGISQVMAGVAAVWGSLFEEVKTLLSNGERQYGVANHSYADYMLDRFELRYTLLAGKFRTLLNIIIMKIRNWWNWTST